jgi:hypothetical protein
MRFPPTHGQVPASLLSFARHLMTPRSARLVVAASVLCYLGVAALAGGSMEPADPADRSAPAFLAADRQRGASRDADRRATPTDAKLAISGAQKKASAKPKAAPKKAAPKKAARRKPALPKPVAGLSQVQTNNAYAIVQIGKALKMPRRGVVIAVATAIQESTLLNRASEVLPESYRYPHQGTGSDHDSVGLFQQRPSSGWGSVRNLMNPAYAATQFYLALKSVAGWQYMSLTGAAQAVQVSAYPDAYAKHEALAAKIVAALS